jgi:hypothetical protein
MEEKFQPDQYKLPKEYECPVTREIMEHPVLAADGHTYDRYAIEYWLSSHSTSPVTNAEIESSNLLPNHTIHTLIEQHRHRLGQTMLNLVSRNDAYTTVENVNYLLEQGGNINIRTPSGDSLIMSAIRIGRLDIVKLLLKHNVDVTCGPNDQDEDIMSLAKSLPKEMSSELVQLLTPIFEKALKVKEERRVQAEASTANGDGTGNNGDGEDNSLLPGFPQLVNGWNIDSGVGFFPSLFSLLFHNFLGAPNELPTANENYMNKTLQKFTIGIFILSIMLILFL